MKVLEEFFEYLPAGHRNRPGHTMIPKGILFHTTNNWTPGANGAMHAKYMLTTSNQVSWHDTVDRHGVTHHIRYNESAWHAGDGNGPYNRGWIGVEICCEAIARNERLDKETYDNAVSHIAKLMAQFAFVWDQLQPHKVVYGKDCPHSTLFDRDQFKRDVFKKMEEEKKKTPFPDVPAEHWAEDDIALVHSRGLMNGYPNGTFGPDKFVTRAELASIIASIIRKGVGG